MMDRADEEARDTMRVLRQLAGPSFTRERILDLSYENPQAVGTLAAMAEHLIAAVYQPVMPPQPAYTPNVEVVPLALDFAGVSGSFDVVHSFGAFERIPSDEGFELIEAMLDRLTRRGGGMLHVAFAGEAPGEPAARSSKVLRRLLGVGEPADRPSGASGRFTYDLNRVFGVLKARGIDRVAARFTDREGVVGAKIFFWRGY